MRFLLPLPLPSRRQNAAATGPRTGGFRGFSLCCPLSHLLVVVANTLQLAMMVAFLCLLLVCLAKMAPVSWFVVFTPLWVSDSVTLVTGVHEIYRLARVRPEAFTSRRNALIAQVNRLKGSVGVATFKVLLAMRQVRARDHARHCGGAAHRRPSPRFACPLAPPPPPHVGHVYVDASCACRTACGPT
jgi:hypothetical protein